MLARRDTNTHATCRVTLPLARTPHTHAHTDTRAPATPTIGPPTTRSTSFHSHFTHLQTRLAPNREKRPVSVSSPASRPIVLISYRAQQTRPVLSPRISWPRPSPPGRRDLPCFALRNARAQGTRRRGRCVCRSNYIHRCIRIFNLVLERVGRVETVLLEAGAVG
ncbi:hypothetical protein EJ04DRAFT_233510 [Polyplosphaeria fusca]|uniref:Uncharacterized protein n=1 Tax=Polyplosphaeria fusca TaxID=682080 RepID=A0A9P4R6U6_9PLEO|nr:hypothetical protein EJ04DRAFT_233510 [Polyplosphaeria fusca]